MSVKAILTEQQKSYTKAEEDALLATKVPTSRTINGYDLTTNRSLSANDIGAVPTSRTINNKALSSNITLTAADVGALPADGTAVGSYRMMYVHSITGAAGWYHFLDISTTEGQTRVIQLLIDNGQSSVSGILRIYMYRSSSGSLVSSSIVNWMTTTIPIDYVRWTYSNGVTSFYVYKSSSVDRAMTFTVLSAINRAGTNLAPSILEWDNAAVSEPTTATPATANILNNAATADSATNALNDGNGDQIDTTYLKTTDTTKAPAKAGVYYGICDTSASTAIKQVTINELSGITSLTTANDGLTIRVHFKFANSATSGLSLKLNNLQEYPIVDYFSSQPSIIGNDITWPYEQVLEFTFTVSQGGSHNYAWVINRPWRATTSTFGITSLADSVTSFSTAYAATANSVRQAYDLAASKSKLVRFTAQAVSAASNAEIFRITNSEITTNTEVVSVEFANPSYITAGGSWTSYAGYVAFTGTCTTATTANIILKI